MKIYNYIDTYHFLNNNAKCLECNEETTIITIPINGFGIMQAKCNKCEAKYEILFNGALGRISEDPHMYMVNNFTENIEEYNKKYLNDHIKSQFSER